MCMNETDWNKFQRGELAVNCRTEKESKEFVEECFNKGINVGWLGIPNYSIDYDAYGEDVTYIYNYQQCGHLQVNNIEWCKLKNLAVVRYSLKEELTFKEIMENNIPGIYRKCNDCFDMNRVESIRITHGGDVYIEADFEDLSGLLLRIPNIAKFKLQEPKKLYTLFEVIHKIDGKHYIFRADMNINLKPKDFVICDTKHGKTFGRIIGKVTKKLTEEEYNLYKECWLT